MMVEGISISSLLKAKANFDDFCIDMKSYRDKAGAVQAFEFTYELAWKTMKRIMEKRGKIANSPKETFRMAALEGMIRDPETWFEFIRVRNLTVHTYDIETLNEVVLAFDKFSQAVYELINHLKSIGSDDTYRN